MKHFITLKVFLLSLSMLSAQNPLFLGFDSQYEGVRNRLENNEQVKWLSAENNRRIVIEHNNATLTYLFNQGRLYQIDMCKQFESKKEGKAAFDGVLKYFKMIATNELAFNNRRGKHCRISEKSGKLYDLHLVELEAEPKEGFLLKLTSRDPRLTPMAMREAGDFHLAMDENRAVEHMIKGLITHQTKYL
jgi:hypothetical protein